MEMNRRSFLTGAVAAGAVAAAGLAGCSPKAPATAEQSAAAGAGAATSWRDKPETPTDIAEVFECDICVVGAGNGGLPAAVTAAQNGAKVIVLQKGSQIQSAREAIGAISTKLGGEHADTNVAKMLNHMNLTQSGDTNMLVMRQWAEQSGEMIEWLAETLAPKGMELPFEWYAPSDPEAYYPAMCYNPCIDYQPDGPNYGAYMHLEQLAEVFGELGGEIKFMTPATMLVQDESGRVTGVIAENDEAGVIQVNAAKGVILSTGGYGANDEMLMDMQPGTQWCVLRDAVGETGDGIRMALWAGARLEAGGGSMIWNRGIMFDDTVFDGSYSGGDIFLPGSQPFLHVNANGVRFMNEDQCYPMSWAAGANQPGHFSWIVWDGKYYDDITRFDTCGCSRLVPAPSGTAFNADVYDCEALSKEHMDAFWLEPRIESGALKKCDTIEELAAAMHFNEEQTANFMATLERYNSLVEAGEDVDFGKPAYRLSSVVEPPFYAARIAGELLCTIHGIITNEFSQPLKDDGTVIDGLYVVGNDQGGFYPHNYPSNFTGINAGRVHTFGRIAAKHALGLM